MKEVPKAAPQFSDIRRVRPVQAPIITSKKQRFLPKPWIAGLVLIVVLVIVGSATFMVFQHRENTKPIDGKASLESVEARVSKHFLLPTDEIPALATITDSSKLNTPFFKRAKNGDKILIYQKHKIAIMYRASIDRVVEVGPVSLGNLGNQ